MIRPLKTSMDLILVEVKVFICLVVPILKVINHKTIAKFSLTVIQMDNKKTITQTA